MERTHGEEYLKERGKMIRKLLITIVVFFMMVVPGLTANKFYWATGLTGGGAALDGIDGVGLTAGDSAIVALDSGTNAPVHYFYRVQASSASELSPGVIVPNTNAGTSAWHLSSVITPSLSPVIDDPDNFAANFTGANLYGGTFIANATGTAALPNPGVGMNFTILVATTGQVIIDPLGTGTADTIWRNGLAAAADENLTTPATAVVGSMCVAQYRAADVWMFTCDGGFLEATPP
jgi:hypothetical protein